MATGWLAEADVLADLGLAAADGRIPRCVAAAEAHVSSWRDDVTEWTDVNLTHPNLYMAGVQAAALIWQSNVTPEGFAGFDEAGGLIGQGDAAKWMQIRRLARAGKPKVG